MLADDDPGDQWIYEGRHRITAMRDAGVRRTLLVRLQLINTADETVILIVVFTRTSTRPQAARP